MTWLWGLIATSKPARWLVWAGGAVLGLLALLGLARRDAAQDARRDIEHEYERETSRRVEAGREALRDGGDGAPDDRVSGNDSKW